MVISNNTETHWKKWLKSSNLTLHFALLDDESASNMISGYQFRDGIVLKLLKKPHDISKIFLLIFRSFPSIVSIIISPQLLILCSIVFCQFLSIGNLLNSCTKIEEIELISKVF